MDERRFLKNAFRLFKWACLYVLLVVALLALGKLVEVYHQLALTSRVLAWGFVVVLTAPAVYIVWRGVWLYLRVPSTARPPDPALSARNPEKYRRKVRVFARLVGDNLKRNERLDEFDRHQIEETITRIEATIGKTEKFEPRDFQRQWETGMASIYKKLDVLAESEVKNTKRLTAVATAASRKSALDAVIQLLQMAAMTNRLIHIYWTRPGVLVTFNLCRDILASAGAVVLVSEFTQSSFFNKGVSFIQRLARDYPVIGALSNLLDEAVQGSFSYILVDRYGKTVMQRCRAIEWNNAQVSEEVRTDLDKEAKAKGTKRLPVSDESYQLQVFDLLHRFSWAEGAQPHELTAALLDYVAEQFDDAQQRLVLFDRLRQKPTEARTLLSWPRFWGKDRPGPTYSPACRETFLSIVEPLRPEGFSASEQQFLSNLSVHEA